MANGNRMDNHGYGGAAIPSQGSDMASTEVPTEMTSTGMLPWSPGYDIPILTDICFHAHFR